MAQRAKEILPLVDGISSIHQWILIKDISCVMFYVIKTVDLFPTFGSTDTKRTRKCGRVRCWWKKALEKSRKKQRSTFYLPYMYKTPHFAIYQVKNSLPFLAHECRDGNMYTFKCHHVKMMAALNYEKMNHSWHIDRTVKWVENCFNAKLLNCYL